jgi:DNA-directed RNA polymerase specialized sigma24 family protein
MPRIAKSVPSSVPSAEERVAHQQLARHLSELLAELPLQQQRALRLYYYEEASMGQIAAKLDVSELARPFAD